MARSPFFKLLIRLAHYPGRISGFSGISQSACCQSPFSSSAFQSCAMAARQSSGKKQKYNHANLMHRLPKLSISQFDNILKTLAEKIRAAGSFCF
jgi:hypothetical protein